MFTESPFGLRCSIRWQWNVSRKHTLQFHQWHQASRVQLYHEHRCTDKHGPLRWTRNTAKVGPLNWEAGSRHNTSVRVVGYEFMEPTQTVCEACLQWPSGILQATEDSNKTKEWGGGVGGGTGIKYATIMRGTSRFLPQNHGGFSVVYTNRPGGEKLNKFSI